jgi:probable rRNA maturation factor
MKHRSLSSQEIDVSIAAPFQKELSEDWLRMVVEAGLAEALPEGEPAQVGLVVADDDTVRELNRKFRGLDEVTDVLSFSAVHSGVWAGEGEGPSLRRQNAEEPEGPAFILQPGEHPPLGEVIISLPQTRRQALERSIPVDQELALLIVHGVLHLVGYDHLETGDQARMQSRERAALAAVSNIEARIK